MSEDRLEIVSDILEPIYENKRCEVSQLKRKMYLSKEQLEEYIDFLSRKEYLELEKDNGKKQVSITEKGKVFFKITNLKKSEKKS